MFDGHDGIARLGRGQEMAHGADAADARGDAGHFLVRPALAKLLEAAKLDHVELGVGHVAGVVQENADLGVALDAGYGVNDDAFRHREKDCREAGSAKLELSAFQFGGGSLRGPGAGRL